MTDQPMPDRRRESKPPIDEGGFGGSAAETAHGASLCAPAPWAYRRPGRRPLKSEAPALSLRWAYPRATRKDVRLAGTPVHSR
jgi:hypothetical protein